MTQTTKMTKKTTTEDDEQPTPRTGELLTGGLRKVGPRQARRVVEVLEIRVLVVDFQHDRPVPAQPRRHLVIPVSGILHAQPRPRHPLHPPPPQTFLDPRLAS